MRRPETFDFLGFTFYMGKSRKGNTWSILKTSVKKFTKAAKAFKTWLYNKEQRVIDIIKQLKVKLNGYYRYYGVTFNSYDIQRFVHVIKGLLYKALNRRGCCRTYIWVRYYDMLKLSRSCTEELLFAVLK